MNTKLKVLQNKGKETISSLELVKEINVFREQEYNYKLEKGLSLGKVEKKNGKYTELRHDTLLAIIRDEFEEEINDQKILEVKYKDKKEKLEQCLFLP